MVQSLTIRPHLHIQNLYRVSSRRADTIHVSFSFLSFFFTCYPIYIYTRPLTSLPSAVEYLLKVNHAHSHPYRPFYVQAFLPTTSYIRRQRVQVYPLHRSKHIVGYLSYLFVLCLPWKMSWPVKNWLYAYLVALNFHITQPLICGLWRFVHWAFWVSQLVNSISLSTSQVFFPVLSSFSRYSHHFPIRITYVFHPPVDLLGTVPTRHVAHQLTWFDMRMPPSVTLFFVLILILSNTYRL